MTLKRGPTSPIPPLSRVNGLLLIHGPDHGYYPRRRHLPWTQKEYVGDSILLFVWPLVYGRRVTLVWTPCSVCLVGPSYDLWYGPSPPRGTVFVTSKDLLEESVLNFLIFNRNVSFSLSLPGHKNFLRSCTGLRTFGPSDIG